MKIIFKIARTELRNLYYSPVAWFLAIVFFIQCAVFYTYALVPFAKWQDIMSKNNPKFRDPGQPLTSIIFLNPGNGIIGNVLQNLYLFIPLLTMGLISREVNNGSIKLLYSSPVKVRHIVLGKYLAVMVYNLLLIALVGVFMVTAAFNIPHIDSGILLSALLGFYLLVCAYTAIGLFMSSVTTYQVVSAIGTFIIIFILSRIGTLWQKYDFVRDLTYFLSIVGRTGKMMRGLITTKDILYFLMIVYIFVGFTMLRLKSGRESRPWFINVGRYILVFASALLIGYAGSLPSTTIYWDTTARQINTIHPTSQKIVKDLGNDPLEITLYSNLLGPGLRQGLPESRNTYLTTVWEKYVRFKPNITFKYEYYYDLKTGDSNYYKGFPGKNLQQIAEQMADGNETKMSLFKSPAQIRRIVNLDDENQRSVMQLKYKGRSVFLRTFNDVNFWPDEMHIAAAFKRLEHAKLPKIYYLTGNLERSIHKSGEREFKDHSIEKLSRYSLVNLGFDADTLLLDTQDIPADATALVLADPKTELSETTTNKIKQYIANGGNMFILGEPGKQQMLNPILKELGVQLMPGNLVEPTQYEMPQIIRPYFTPASANIADDPHFLWMKEQIKENEFTDTMELRMPGATAIAMDSTSPFTITPLMVTRADKGWLKMGTLVTDSAQVEFRPQDGDVKGSYATTVGLTRKINNKEQRIIVCSDADFMSNARGGGDFMSNAIFSYLDNNEFPIYESGKHPRDSKVSISPAGVSLMIILYVWVIPALMLLAGVVLLVRRKRK
jgi:ABC-2 type transport system permease protein